MSNNYYKKGDNRVICDICKAKRFRSECKIIPAGKEKGLLACLPNQCYSAPHPNDFPLRIGVDMKPIRNARPESPDLFVSEGTGGYSKWGSKWLTGGGFNDAIWGNIPEKWEDL
jgi:hypothetical protein